MLYDPKWNAPAKVGTIASLIAWLETQPPDRPYDYDCNGGCLLALYYTAMGCREVCMGSTSFYHFVDGKFQEEPLPEELNHIAIARIRLFHAHDRSLTFGGALKRARLRLSAEQGTP